MIKYLHRLILSCLFLACMAVVQAQEYPIYNQYYFNYYLVNPALAGANDCSYFMLTHKQQWTGIDDAPYTTSASFQTRLRNNIGLGAYIYNDNNGYSQQQAGQFTVAYHIPMSDGYKYSKSVRKDRQLSLAVSAKLFNYGFDQDIFDEYASSGRYDVAMENLGNLFAFNANIGAYYSSYGFFTGLTVTNLTRIKMSAEIDDLEPVIPITGFFLVGNEFELSYDQTLEPSLMTKFDENGSFGFDINLRYSQEVTRDNFSYWLQMTFRQSLDELRDYQTLGLMPMAGFQFGKFHIAYAFSLDLNRMFRYNYGTHELMLGYTLCKVKKFCR